MSSHTWLDGYETYMESIITKLDDIYLTMGEDDQLENLSEDVQQAWHNCAFKARLILQSPNLPLIPEYLSFMSASVWDSLSKQLKRVPKSLLEVCAFNHDHPTQICMSLRYQISAYLHVDARCVSAKIMLFV